MDDQGCPTLKRRTHGNDILNEAQILPYNLVGHRNIRHTALRGPRCPKNLCPRRSSHVMLVDQGKRLREDRKGPPMHDPATAPDEGGLIVLTPFGDND